MQARECSPIVSADGKLFDAAVSHAEKCKLDVDFCLQEMIPILETQLGYKLHFTFRDEVPGSGLHPSFVVNPVCSLSDGFPCHNFQ